ncbi:MAG: hypothetical protein JKY32_13115 [Rhizobiales bacterium]|nr:hypothetical protein [Hyphomicrobiales bacterium]
MVAVSFLFAATGVFASPVGTYDVVGTHPDDDGEYTGVVTVTRTGETYQVIWDVQGTRFIGTGLGAVIRNNQFLIGAANKNDIAISVGYTSGNSFGMAMYFLKEDGRWEGVWTSGGSRNVATETWYPR